MGSSTTPAGDVFYDLVSIQFHALKGAQVYDQYLRDAEGNDEVRQFIERVKEEDNRRAEQAHRLLGQLSRDNAGAMG